MAGAPATPLVVSTIVENTLAHWLNQFVRFANDEPLVGLRIVEENTDGIGESSYVHQFNQRGPLTGVAVVPEADEAPEALPSLTPGQITGDQHGLMTFISNKANLVSIQREHEVNVVQLRMAWRQFWHTQVLALFTGVTKTSGDSATTNTLQNWDFVTAAFRNDNPIPGARWAVLNPDAVRDLRTNIRTSAASLYATPMVEANARAVTNTTPGLGVQFDGYTLYESADTPVGDTTGWTNCLGLKAGQQSALEMDIYDRSRVTVQAENTRFGIYQIIGGILGVGIRTQESARKFITKT
jgi:hypothetical protein